MANFINQIKNSALVTNVTKNSASFLGTFKNRIEYLGTEALDFLMTEDDNYLITGVGAIKNQLKS